MRVLSAPGGLEFTQVAWLALGRTRSHPHSVLRDPPCSHEQIGSDVHVLLQESGATVVQQSRREFVLEAGRWAVLPADRPYSILNKTRNERLTLVIGRERLSAGVELQSIAGRSHSAASGISRLMFSAATFLADELHVVCDKYARELAEQITTLLNVALGEVGSSLCGHAPEGGSLNDTRHPDDLRCERVRRYLARNLRDPQLSVDRIASDLKCSRRTLARIFRGYGESCMEYVYRQRLEGVRRDLLDPALRQRTLGEIALAWGFNNYTHFSDRFRLQYGVSPMTLRRRTAAAAHAEGAGRLHE